MFNGLKSFKFAVQTWFASFYILSIEYPIEIRETCNFLDKVLMRGEGEGKFHRFFENGQTGCYFRVPVVKLNLRSDMKTQFSMFKKGLIADFQLMFIVLAFSLVVNKLH